MPGTIELCCGCCTSVIFPLMNSPEVSVVTFLMVGCQRCGTTWTAAAIRDHPEVYLPSKKQSYFFDRNYDKGIDWYLERFKEAEPQHLAVGEISTGYCLTQISPLLAKQFPNVKLIKYTCKRIRRSPLTDSTTSYPKKRKIFNYCSIKTVLMN